MITALLIAISLNFDTFSVAVVEGTNRVKPSFWESLKVGLFFGIGQAFMALLGFLLGLSFKILIMSIDHWIAFFLLGLIGLKMIKESGKKDVVRKKHQLDWKTLIILVIASSIDAMVVGITLGLIKSSILINTAIIGFVTFLISFVGFYAGNKLRSLYQSKIKVVGGLILILIGIKILLQHLFFGS